jgi:hypothetical protein
MPRCKPSADSAPPRSSGHPCACRRRRLPQPHSATAPSPHHPVEIAQTGGSFATIQVDLTNCLLPEIAKNRASFSYDPDMGLTSSPSGDPGRGSSQRTARCRSRSETCARRRTLPRPPADGRQDGGAITETSCTGVCCRPFTGAEGFVLRSFCTQQFPRRQGPSRTKSVASQPPA